MPKITFSHNFLWIHFRRNFTFLLGLCLSIFIFSFNSASVFALYTPTLSASVDNTVASVNGNQVINSTNKTTEIPLNLTVNTNNKTGYTATLNSETDETALVNVGSTSGAKINSISSAGPLGDFSNNTWSYKFGTSTNYVPIPALSTPAQILQTTVKTNGNETNSIKIGMKLGDNLESGRYTNKLVFSILTNNYNRIAIMTEGPDFNTKLRALGAATDKIEHFKKSSVAPAASMNTVNIDDEASDYEIKLWLDPTDKTAYYYAESEKVYLNVDSGLMFYREYNEQKIKNIVELDLSNFDTSQVTDMQFMFYGMSSLTSLDLSNFDTSQVKYMNSMFSGTSLTSLNLSNFDTSKVMKMSNMFFNMRNLTSLNLTNFNTSKVTDMEDMFSLSNDYASDDKLEKIYANNDFDISKLTAFSNMFRNRKKLRGGNGSYLANPSTADKTWLRVDRPGVQGYFTRKP